MTQSKEIYLIQLECPPVDLEHLTEGVPVIYTGPFDALTTPNIGGDLAVPDFLLVVDPSNFGQETHADNRYFHMDYSVGRELRHNHFYGDLERAPRLTDISGHLDALIKLGDHSQQTLFYVSDALKQKLEEKFILEENSAP